MSQLPYSGLERDPRKNQDELPTVHDSRDQSKYLSWQQPQYSNRKDEDVDRLASQPSPESKQICGIPRTTFWLIVALAVVLALGVVGAGVAGSLAVKRGRTADQLSSAQRDSSGSPTDPVTASASCPTLPTSTPSNTVNCTHVPAHDCESLPQPPNAYVSSLTKHLFAISCATDFPGGDMIGVFVYNFGDCIEACASYNMNVADPRLNSTCLGVSYDISFLKAGGLGNCFLKSTLGDGPRGKNVTSSAVVIRH